MTKIKGKPAKPPWKGVYWWKREDHIGPVWRLDVWCEAQITLEKDVSIKPQQLLTVFILRRMKRLEARWVKR